MSSDPTPRQKAGRINRGKRGPLSGEGLEALRKAALMNCPWVHATGPRSVEGKNSSRWNALKHGERSQTLIQGFVNGLEQADSPDEVNCDRFKEAIAVLMTMGTPESLWLASRLSRVYTNHLEKLLDTGIQ